jgi:outer membrane protein
MMRTLLVLALLAALPRLATAQSRNVQTLNLDEAVALALESSYAARSQKLILLQAEREVAAARGRFKTFLDLDLKAPDYSESVTPVNQPGQLPVYSTYGDSEWRAGLTLTQPLPTNGRFALTGAVLHRTNSVLSADGADEARSRTVINDYRLDFVQPLFVPNALRLSLERARLNLDESRRHFTAAQLDIVYDVTAEFYGFLRAERQLDIARAELVQQEEAFQLASRKFSAGLIPEVEALQMEVDLAQSRSSLLAAEGHRATASDRFKLRLGLPLEADLAVVAADTPRFYDVDVEVARQHALAHRAEISDAAAARRRAEITVAETDARSAITGELRAYYDLTGVGSSDAYRKPADLWDLSWDDLERRPGNRGAAFTLSVPIWDSGVNRAEVAAARAALARSDLDRDEQQRRVVQSVNAALTALAESRGRLEALGRSVELAGKSLDISLQRFDNGDITSQELALDRDRLTQARMAYLDAFIGFQLAGADLRRQTLYDFEAGASLVAE